MVHSMDGRRRAWSARGGISTCGALAFVLSCGGAAPRTSLGMTDQQCRLETRTSGSEAVGTVAAGLLLAASVDYESTIKSLLNSKCVSCHSGNTPPNLSTYQLAKGSIDAVLSAVEANRMPPGAPLEDAEKANLRAWKDGNTPQRTSTVDAPPASGSGGTPSSGSEGNTGEPSKPTPSGGIDTKKLRPVCGKTEVLDPFLLKGHPAMKSNDVGVCQQQGLIYDRNNLLCGPAKVAKGYECTRDGIIKIFSDKVSGGVEAVLNEAMGSSGISGDFGQFYSIDQCGEFADGMPIVYLIRLLDVKANGKSDVQLQVKELSVKSK